MDAWENKGFQVGLLFLNSIEYITLASLSLAIREKSGYLSLRVVAQSLVAKWYSLVSFMRRTRV